MRPIVDVIREHLATWEPHPPHVELAVFRTAEPAAIAKQVDELCVAALGASIAGARFWQSSVGAVAGVVLCDGREVVIKAHQPNVRLAQLVELVRIRGCMVAAGSPRVLAGPLPLGAGCAVIEELDERGAWGEPHEPEVRRALAEGLFAIVDACRPIAAASTLDGMTFVTLVGARLWPTPHSKLFDFEATAAGAGWIDDVARAARDVAPAGDIVIGHADWRAEHVRLANGRVVVAYDWDSLARDREPALVGSCAHAFTADWTREDRAQAPSLDEARAFVADYEAARGRPFDREERRACGATFAYACAYTARCGHAQGADEREVVGTFQHLVARHGRALAAL